MTSPWYSLWPAAAVNFFYYGVLGGVISYLAILLTSRDFSSIEVGQLFATFTLLRVLGGQLWAYLSDRKNDPLWFFQLGIVLTFLFFLPALFSHDKWVTSLSVVAAMTCFMSIVSQIEVLSLTAAKDSPATYNRIRLFGSIGFILAAILVGGLLDYRGPVLVIEFGLFVLVCTWLISLKLESKGQSSQQLLEDVGETGFLQRCLKTGFIMFMIASVLLQISFAPYVGFFTKFLAENGYQGINIGLLFSLGTFAEIFLFMFAGVILAKYNIKLLMFVCLILTAIRWATVAVMVDVWWVVVVTQFIHALSFGLMHSVSIYFIRQHFSSSQQNRGQFMYLGVTYGLGGAIGASLTGLTWNDGAGGQQTFIWAAACVLLAALLILITPRKNFQYDTGRD